MCATDGTHWEHGLPPRQLEILRLAAEGRSNKQIARELGIRPRTVQGHLSVVFLKLGVETRTQAVVAAWRRGWVE
jgi:DNA-binding NarL/FixJ family response regulator